MPNNKAFIAEAKQALALWDGPFEGHYFLVRTAIEGYQYVHLRYGKAACKHLLADAQKHIAATPGAIVCEQVAQEAFSFLLYSEEPVTLDYLERMLGHRSEKFEAAHATYFSDCGTRMVFGVCAIKVGDVEEADVSARLACMDAHNARGRVRSFNLEAFNRAARERSREIEPALRP